MRTVQSPERETNDAPPGAADAGDSAPPRRWTRGGIARVVVVVALLFFIGLGIARLQERAGPVAAGVQGNESQFLAGPNAVAAVPPPDAPPTAIAPEPPLSADRGPPADASRREPRPIARRQPRADRAGTGTQRPARSGSGVAVIVDRVVGDGTARVAAERTLRRRLAAAGLATDGRTGVAVSLRVDVAGGGGATVDVRCGLSLARLPRRNVVGSFSARAAADGDGTPAQELANDAGEACGAALADDLMAWLQKDRG